ncbi:MAG: MFS transporter [bacterium]
MKPKHKPESETLELSEDFVRKNFKWNLTVNVLDFGLFMTGMSFVSVTTILPAFVRHFTSSNVLIGLIPAFRTVGYFLPQLAIANYVERLTLKKPFVLLTGVAERLPWLLLAATTFFILKFPPVWGIALFFVLYVAAPLGGGLATPAWLDMIAKVIPQRRRGRFAGLSNFLGGILGMVGASLTVYILERYAFPENFAICFLIAFLFTSISWVSLSLTREPAHPVADEKHSFGVYARQLGKLLKEDRNYSIFLVASVFLSFSGMAPAFFTVNAIGRLNLSGGEVGGFTFFLVMSQTIFTLLWGYLGDRKGYKIVIILGVLCNISASILAILANSVYLFYGLFSAIGSAMSAEMIANLNIVLEFGPPEKRPTYIGLTNTIRAPFTGIAPT